MRKNSVRKFVHMAIDILPLLIIPIFAININQKSVEPISIEVQEKYSFDFNQKFKTDDVNYSTSSLNTSISNGLISFNTLATGLLNQNILPDEYTMNLITGHKYYPRLIVVTGDSNIINTNLFLYLSYLEINQIRTLSTSRNALHLYYGNLQQQVSLEFYFNVFDLTQMFGSGNEPTKEEFDTLFTSIYYPNIESQKMLVNKPTPTMYNDTDIGSQFLYSLYKPVQDYFNFNNLFNMGQIYDWIQLNLFSGTAPLPIFIIWNIIVYEFFVDLIFLLYAVFMFVIDFATCMIDSFMGKARKGV